MFQSFFVYITFGLILFILGRLAHIRQKHNLRLNQDTSFWVWEVLLALLVFAFVSGVRWNVGVDYLAYLNNYLNFQRGGEGIFEKEIGFDFLTQLMADADIHFSVYFGLLAFLQLFFIYKAFKDQRYLYPFLGIVILFGPHYLSWMNGIRQMLAATMFVFAIQFIHQRQLLKYAAIIGLAGLFHTSAFALIIFYFIPQRDYFKNRILLFILTGATLILGSMSFWIDNLMNFAPILDFIGYDRYAENLGSLIEDEQIRNLGPRRLSLIITALLSIWYGPKLKHYFKNTYFTTYFNFAILGFLLYNLLGNTHHIFIRPLTYLTIFSIPVTAYLIVYLINNFSKNKIMTLVTIAIILAYLPMSIIADYGKGIQDYTNYQFYWYHYKK